MKVLLIADIEKLGWLGDVVEVAEGYARNYLLPQKLAVVPSEANIKSIADEKEKRAEQRLQEQKRMQAAAEKVQDASVSIEAKANEQGHLFGSVTEKDIAKALREQGYEVADEIVRLDEHIKEVGTKEVTLKYTADVTATVSVNVVAEGQEAENAEGAEAPSGEESEPVQQESE